LLGCRRLGTGHQKNSEQGGHGLHGTKMNGGVRSIALEG
jgi:hypothetical protein